MTVSIVHDVLVAGKAGNLLVEVSVSEFRARVIILPNGYGSTIPSAVISSSIMSVYKIYQNQSTEDRT